MSLRQIIGLRAADCPHEDEVETVINPPLKLAKETLDPVAEEAGEVVKDISGIDKLEERREKLQQQAQEQREAAQARSARRRQEATRESAEQNRRIRAARRLRRTGGSQRQLLFSGGSGSTSSGVGTSTSLSGT